jgi:hypothetical protein
MRIGFVATVTRGGAGCFLGLASLSKGGGGGWGGGGVVKACKATVE